MERKGVLLLTIFPVITGLIASAIWAAASGRLAVARAGTWLVVEVALIGLLGFSYWKASRAEANPAPSGPARPPTCRPART